MSKMHRKQPPAEKSEPCIRDLLEGISVKATKKRRRRARRGRHEAMTMASMVRDAKLRVALSEPGAGWKGMLKKPHRVKKGG
jgi:hypothetical protein